MSVVVATKERPELLRDQLVAFTSQTHAGRWELIVAVNGALDGTSEVVEEFAGRLPVRLVAAAERPGVSFARNRGAAAARGDYLLFVDDDDRVTPGWLSAMAAAAEHADILRGKDRLVRRGPDGVETGRVDREGLDDFFGFLPSISGANCGIRTTLFREVGGFDERYQRLEDTEMFWRAQMASAAPPRFVPDAVLEYRLRSGWRAVWRGAYGDSRASARLYRDFRSLGMPRRPLANLGGWARIARYGPRWIFSYRGREELAKEAGWLIGRLVGSVCRRVFYL